MVKIPCLLWERPSITSPILQMALTSNLHRRLRSGASFSEQSPTVSTGSFCGEEVRGTSLALETTTIRWAERMKRAPAPVNETSSHKVTVRRETITRGVTARPSTTSQRMASFLVSIRICITSSRRRTIWVAMTTSKSWMTKLNMINKQARRSYPTISAASTTLTPNPRQGRQTRELRRNESPLRTTHTES